MPHTPDYLRRTFTHFAGMCANRSPLYAALSARVAEEPAVFSLVAETQRGQPAVNLLFAGVQYLLLRGAEHELRGFYPSVGGTRPAGDAWPVFADFCRQFERELVEIACTRQVQTNEVGRCGALMPAFGLAFESGGGRALHLIDIGASAGLLLQFDRYRYEYVIEASGECVCGPNSPACVRTEVRGEGRGDLPFPPPAEMPAVADRVGVDLAPVDVRDDDAVDWVASLIWADQVERIELFRRAVEIARISPPRVLEGDALALLPALLEDVSADALPCVFHSRCIYQWSKEDRAALDAMLANFGARRDLAHVSLEWLGDDPGPQLHLTTYLGGTCEVRHLADCDHHGAWLRGV